MDPSKKTLSKLFLPAIYLVNFFFFFKIFRFFKKHLQIIVFIFFKNNIKLYYHQKNSIRPYFRYFFIVKTCSFNTKPMQLYFGFQKLHIVDGLAMEFCFYTINGFTSDIIFFSFFIISNLKVYLASAS